MNQTKLSIRTLDFDIPKDHISRFVVEFIEETYPICPDLDGFKCHENQYLHHYSTYIEKQEDLEKPDKIKRLYNNYNACKTVMQETSAVQYHKHIKQSQNMDQNYKKQCIAKWKT